MSTGIITASLSQDASAGEVIGALKALVEEEGNLDLSLAGSEIITTATRVGPHTPPMPARIIGYSILSMSHNLVRNVFSFISNPHNSLGNGEIIYLTA